VYRRRRNWGGNRRLLVAVRLLGLLLTWRGLAKVTRLIIVITITGLQSDRLVLLLSKLSEERIQTIPITRATRVSRHSGKS
jgi:hypothetical protein